MTKTAQTNQLADIVSSCIDDDPKAILSAKSIALCAMKLLDPDNKSPELVSYGCNLELRQIARQQLRRKYDPQPSEITSTGQAEMFEKLQSAYPAKRNGESVYVPLMQLTLDELMENTTRLRRMGESFIKGSDALQAHTLTLMESGFFSDTA